ncbi:hypothetical protein HNQ42_003136 [Rummeliibacillus stabekisii]|nr:hypothetical protein [Rummeliibacillus stabekisii]GEL06287.1 hypothetical protein RST01_29140 [Rummeliibacillus stabekisii]
MYLILYAINLFVASSYYLFTRSGKFTLNKRLRDKRIFFWSGVPTVWQGSVLIENVEGVRLVIKLFIVIDNCFIELYPTTPLDKELINIFIKVVTKHLVEVLMI